jgi:probable rRNA maturation factor
MIRVRVFKTSNYPVAVPPLKKKVKAFLLAKSVSSDAEISIAFVSKPRMLEIVKKYLKENNLHNVLSFTESEVGPKFVYPPDSPLQLGEVVVCYPVAVEEAKKENLTIDEKVWQLVEHGIMHLLGYHHKE